MSIFDYIQLLNSLREQPLVMEECLLHSITSGHNLQNVKRFDICVGNKCLYIEYVHGDGRTIFVVSVFDEHWEPLSPTPEFYKIVFDFTHELNNQLNVYKAVTI